MPTMSPFTSRLKIQNEGFAASRTRPKFFWTERGMRLYVNTQPHRHTWDAADSDIRPVLDNIAAAAHACNIQQTTWVRQCFVSSDDATRFLTSLGAFEGHLNSYWFYALLSIVEVDEQAVHTTALLARALAQQAVNSRQLPDPDAGACKTSQVFLEAESRAPCAHVHTAEPYPSEEAELSMPAQTGHGTALGKFEWVKAWLD